MRLIAKIVVLLYPVFLIGAGSDVGTYAGNWLQLETGTRAIGMAGAHVAAGDGVYASPYNSSSISSIDGWDFYFSNTNYIAGIKHQVIGFANQLNDNHYAGLHIFHMDSGDIEVTTIEEPNGFGEYYSVNAFSARLIYANHFLDKKLRTGASVKYIREKIHTVYMQSVLLDLGFTYSPIPSFDFGCSVSNIGPDIQFHGPGLLLLDDDSPSGSYEQATKPQPVPLSMRMGVKSTVVGESAESSIFSTSTGSELLISFDAVYSQDEELYSTVGLEYSWKEIAFIRCGTHIGHDTAGLSLGGGLSYKGIGVDFALVDYGIFSRTLQFGIRVEL